MSNDGKVLSLQRRKGEDAAHGSQFLTGEAAHNACLTEQSLNSRIAAGNCSCMTGSCTTATLRRTCLDGCNATAFLDEVTGMEQ